MGVVDDLLRARADYESGDWAAALDTWSGVAPDDMDDADLWNASVSAYLIGRQETAVDFFQRTFQMRLERGDLTGAIRCCFHLSMILATSGQPALSAGWSSRGERVLEELDDDGVERGFVAFRRMYQHLGSGDFPAAAAAAAETTRIARAHGDADLLALGLCAQGRLAIYTDRFADGLASLDEAMATLVASGDAPILNGNAYCIAIEGCQDVADFDRAAEWTTALYRWCSARPGLVMYTGQCSLHRGQILRLRGAWTEALEEFESAVERYRRADFLEAIGHVEGERGDVLRLRGEYDAADAAYQRASEHGFDPQPGLALLWLARGSSDAAAAAGRRLLAEAPNTVQRCRILPAVVDILLAVGAIEEARAAARVLDEVAGLVETISLQASAAYASGAVELAAGDAAGALPYLRKARQLWARAGSPYGGARVRALTGRALTMLGDQESARQELEAAGAGFRELGATPSAQEVERMLRPEGHPAGLTAREVEVLRLVASGRSNTQIATELVLSEKTVARHLSNIFTKLDVGSRTAAAAYAFEHGLV